MAGCDCGLRNSRLVLLIKRLMSNKQKRRPLETAGPTWATQAHCFQVYVCLSRARTSSPKKHMTFPEHSLGRVVKSPFGWPDAFWVPRPILLGLSSSVSSVSFQLYFFFFWLGSMLGITVALTQWAQGGFSLLSHPSQHFKKVTSLSGVALSHQIWWYHQSWCKEEDSLPHPTWTELTKWKDGKLSFLFAF